MSRGVRAKGERVREYLLQSIIETEPNLVAGAAAKFKISRQAVYKHLARLRQQKAIAIEGTHRKPVYRLVPIELVSHVFDIKPGLAEHEVWENVVLPCIRTLPANVLSIWIYAFTEMFNNAIDHSGGGEIRVSIEKSGQATEIIVGDDGVGIFKKIREELGLQDERHALFELSKGKLTTDRRNHSGEGIFFTSRMLDRFEIRSGELFFTHRREFVNDWLVDRAARHTGTYVIMALSNHSARTTKKVFDTYSSKDGDYGFNKTLVPIALAEYGPDGLVSRSQAKRVLARVELFERVVVDFNGVQSIGQAFADQIFRVFALEHPSIELTAINTEPEVRKMVNRALSAKATDMDPKPETE